MRFGVCCSSEMAHDVAAAGFDFIEENVQSLLQGMVPEEQWTMGARVRASVLPVPSANVLVPGTMAIVGPRADFELLKTYMTTVMRRARRLGLSVLVFGSGVSRRVPEGVSREAAFEDLCRFFRMVGGVSEMHDVTVAIEPLNRSESNHINSVSEAMTYVRAVDHPNVRCMLDSYHFWMENDSVESLAAAMPYLRHVHVADMHGRVAPGLSGFSDYKPLFRALKAGGYQGVVSVECKDFDLKTQGRGVSEFLRHAWEGA